MSEITDEIKAVALIDAVQRRRATIYSRFGACADYTGTVPKGAIFN